MYSVNIWGSKPGTNDDCWTGKDYTDKASISDYIRRTVAGPGEVWVELDGPDVHEERQLRNADRRLLERERAADRLEQAMQAGMGLGIDAYNDAMGWGS